MLSPGKIQGGLHLKERREYASLTSGLISIVGIIFCFVMICIALNDCFQKKYMESDVEQGSFSFDKLQQLDKLIERLDILSEVTTTDADFCKTQTHSGYLLKGGTYLKLDVECSLIGQSLTYYKYNVKFAASQEKGGEMIDETWILDLSFTCDPLSKCKNDPALSYNIYLNDYYLNNDNEIYKDRQKFESNKDGTALFYRAKPVQVKTTSSLFSRDPTYDRDLYFSSDLDYTQDQSLDDYTFQVKITQTDQTQLWTTVQKYPRSFAYCMVQIGGYIGFFGIFVCFIKLMNYFSFQKELTRLHMRSLNYDIAQKPSQKDMPENIYTYENFIEMKNFMDRLKKIPEIQKFLDDEKGEKNHLNQYLDDGELRLYRKSTLGRSSVRSLE
ncbi:UNKNOWN [Stylonychia lemnae]|uniref:Transmembrane protein n=1 Tax=Stylonychia lemnae TaxID=5949 RepID=A0A078AFA0_STYLE|nr:UNKNOWN [Stylonychia lemnae]|eukprot:CDW80909.1 UNKNOWN [Stylonychia lemnae]